MATETIAWLDDRRYATGGVQAHLDPGRAWGGKNASLMALTLSGLPVPPGFAVPATAFRAALDEVGIAAMVTAVDPGDPAALARCGSEAREMVQRAGLPPDTAAQVDRAYAALCHRSGIADLPVAVRSSAVCEDMPGFTAAGSHDSYLGVRSSPTVRQCVRRCWASMYNDRAIAYRRHRGVPEHEALMSVTVQQMVPARVAGVAFTVDPLTGDDRYVAIEASWGLGETVASGLVTPDYFLVEKRGGAIVKRVVGGKAREHRLDESGRLCEQPVPEARRAVPCLTDDEVREVAALAGRAEDTFGAAQDVEWAADDRFWLLQSRPESVWRGRRSA